MMDARPVHPSSHADRADKESVTWAAAYRLVRGDLALRRVRAIRCGSCAAHTYPTADGAVVVLGAKLITWLFLFDDAFGEGRQAIDSRELMDTFASYEGALRRGRLPRDPTPFHEALVDLGAEADRLGGSEWHGRFADSMARYFDGCLLERPYRRREEVPTLAAYRRLRAWSIGTFPVFDLIELARDAVLSPDEASDPALAEVRERAALLCAWVNDVYSHRKESEESDPLNLVTVLGREFGLPEGEAFLAAAEVYNTDLALFDRRAAELRLDGPPRVASVVRGLDDWVHGNYAWTALSRRYVLGDRAS